MSVGADEGVSLVWQIVHQANNPLHTFRIKEKLETLWGIQLPKWFSYKDVGYLVGDLVVNQLMCCCLKMIWQLRYWVIIHTSNNAIMWML